MKKLALTLVLFSLSIGCFATVRPSIKEVWCKEVVWHQGDMGPNSQFAICETTDGEKIQVVITNFKQK